MKNNKINTSLSEDELKDMKKRMSDSLSVDRQKLLVRQPFVGGILMRFDLVPVRDIRLPTACTDGSRIYMDMDFYSHLNNEQRLFVLAHECWHNVYMHFLRKRGRNATLWNIATDCEINYMLKQNNFILPDIELCFPDKEDEGKSAEEIYEHLLKKNKKESQKNDSMNDNDSQKNGTKGNSEKNSSNGKLKGQFDKHITDDTIDDLENENSFGTDSWGEKGIDSDYRPRIDDGVSEKIREAIVSEAQKIERQKGTLPGFLSEIIKKLLNPEINWKEELSKYVSACMGGYRRTWLPPNRRHVWQDMYFQSHNSEKINVSVIVDTSGSTTSDLPKFMTELVGLLNSFGNYNMTIVQVDTQVQKVDEYDDFNPFPINDCERFEWKGFGGSDLTSAFEELRSRNIDSDVCVVFTDGYIDCPKYNPLGIDVLFVLTADGEKPCNWGKFMKFKEKRNNDI